MEVNVRLTQINNAYFGGSFTTVGKFKWNWTIPTVILSGTGLVPQKLRSLCLLGFASSHARSLLGLAFCSLRFACAARAS